ncbi:MAG: orotate phosphoribosyltransferase [Proteobacteria bacterium]|nr:orotate phosphoribosyltransferase [Pseudomonadota bacterium]
MSGATADTAGLARGLIETGAVQIDRQPRFLWSSGIRSPIYCDLRLVMGDPVLRGRVADRMADLIRREFPGTELIAGTASAAIAPAAWIAERMRLPMSYVRDKSKQHGMMRRIEGGPVAGRRVSLVEDTVSTGGSAIRSALAIREEEGDLAGIVSIFSYGFEKSARGFREAGIEHRNLIGFGDLLDAAGLESGSDERAELEVWRDRTGRA